MLAGAVTLFGVLSIFACGEPDGEPADSTYSEAATSSLANYVGSAACTTCHAEAAAGWAESHHAQAMLSVEPQNMLGDFDDRELEHYGSSARFHRDGERYLVWTEGADGVARDYEIRWAFGVEPLQQYLVDGRDGRLQVLPYCWDARPAEEGGQRWFHLYPDEPVPPGDLLHWAGPQGEWNFLCADCHTTGFSRGYDVAADFYASEWQEAGVGCEACHGPGSKHVEWAELSDESADSGLLVSLGDTDGGIWTWSADRGLPERSVPRVDHREVETCAACHSRRSALTDGIRPEVDFLDQFRPDLVEEGLYHDDGSILEEVYVWGSFTQSRMYHAGVTCTDCHDPHSGRQRLPGDALCLQCHSAPLYDTDAHEHHAAGTPGSSCVDCHMPERTYMVVDPRRDHGFRIPRPDLAVASGSPSACASCHEEGDAWAAEQLTAWRGDRPPPPEPFGPTFHAASKGDPRATEKLEALVVDSDQPAMVRATALLRLANLGGARFGSALSAAVTDSEPLLRYAAARAAGSLIPEERMVVLELLEDPVRAVRVEAVRVMSVLFAGMDPATQDPALQDEIFGEYLHTLSVRLGRAQGQVEAGLLAANLGRGAEAEARYLRAVELDPNFLPGVINYADLLRGIDRDAEGLELLQQTRDWQRGLNPDVLQSADLDHALGLALVRAGRLEDALALLRSAARAEGVPARYSYVWGVALLSVDQSGDALAVFEQALAEHPWSPELLQGASDASAALGMERARIGYAQRLEALGRMLSE